MPFQDSILGKEARFWKPGSTFPLLARTIWKCEDSYSRISAPELAKDNYTQRGAVVSAWASLISFRVLIREQYKDLAFKREDLGVSCWLFFTCSRSQHTLHSPQSWHDMLWVSVSAPLWTITLWLLPGFSVINGTTSKMRWDERKKSHGSYLSRSPLPLSYTFPQHCPFSIAALILRQPLHSCNFCASKAPGIHVVHIYIYTYSKTPTHIKEITL